MRPWSSIPIVEAGEPLLALPPELLRLEPHPYASLGAPYGSGGSPFRLRSGVVGRLLEAQRQLQQLEPGWRLAIFDGWRPLAVQRFMVEYAIGQECARRGIVPRRDPAGRPSPALAAVEADVARFWAPPSPDPATPPPHSTGAAVDLTLADAQGRQLSLGSPIDAIGPISEPDHFLERAEQLDPGPERLQCLEWHRRRQRLRQAMAAAGFAQHPNEWWHFSWGDQLWAWRSGAPQACYGRCGEASGEGF